jgi:hypothetical protein
MVGGPVPIRNGTELMKKLAQGSEGRYGTLGQHISSDCTPAFKRDLAAVRPKFLASPSLAGPFRVYDKTALDFAARADEYAAGLKNHVDEDTLDHSLVEAARRWSGSGSSPEEASRFESFLACAVPDPSIRLDKDALARWVPPQCTQTSTAEYMDRIRRDCAPILTDAKPAAPTPTDPQEQQALDVIRRARVVNGTMSIPTFLLTVCAEGLRRQWIRSDGAPLLSSYDEVLAAQNQLGTAVVAIKQKLAESKAP